MKIKNLSITENQEYYYKKYEVDYKGKSGIICFSSYDCLFELYSGNFSEREFEYIKKIIFEDAYYNINFSIF